MSDITASPGAVVHPGPNKSGFPASFLSRHSHKILALVPLALLIWVVARCAVDVPFQDQWELVPLLDKTYHGELTFHDLWAQHNEHRILFPRIIMLALARLSGWNIRLELAVNIIQALGIFAVLVHQVNKTRQKLGIAGLHWAIPASSLVVFSISQYENWLWGWQLQMFLNLLAVVGGIVLLAGEPFRWCKFTAAVLLGIVATFSFANGALFWPIGLLILLIVMAGARQRVTAITSWVLFGVLTLGAYFYHYQKPEKHPPLDFIFKMPVEYAAYVFKYIGGICARGLSGDVSTDGIFACIFGLAGTVTFGWAGVTLVRRKIANVRTLLPYFGMSLYSVGSALITGVGRVGFGSNQAVVSRYCTMVTPLWTSLIVFLILLAWGGQKAGDAGSRAPNAARRPCPWICQEAARWLLMTAIILLIVSSVSAMTNAGKLSRRQAFGRARLLDLAANPRSDIDYPGLLAIYPRPKIIVERYPVLVQHRLSLFRDWNAPSAPQ